ncbi:Alpha/Beta hydrolase protein [Blyttiomyces helicus]|uniref:Alpha/Beta hydrolase protein n=1 Tax=Blyttiomyces helicus TaxID=388810 RepID=A0A4V1IR62_9FUNG|nr:Alpha/Beta hydrolase protein [Blyttiomyces helicus]|eukprot:RKO88947.1 Alpha/Beta hydrolase protein [Blyttiomyces helicus]
MRRSNFSNSIIEQFDLILLRQLFQLHHRQFDLVLLCVFVGADDTRHTVIVSFRGTLQTIEGWPHNFDTLNRVTPLYLPTVKVLARFSELYDKVQTFVQEALPAAVDANPGYSISLTGHSHGGASATLAAADAFEYLKGTVSIMLTVGYPRAGNSDFAFYMEQALLGDIWRSTNLGDTIPKELLYRHVGKRSIGLDLNALPDGNPQFCGPDGSGIVTSAVSGTRREAGFSFGPSKFAPIHGSFLHNSG